MKQAGSAWAVLCALMTSAWVVIAFGGGDASPVSTTALGAAASAGTAALLGAGWRPRSLEALQVGGLLLVGLPAAVAAAAGGSTALLAIVLALVAAGEVAVALLGRRPSGLGRWPVRALVVSPGTLVAGCGLLVSSLLTERVDTSRWVLPGQSTSSVALALAGAALLAAAAAIGPPRAWAPAVAAMVVALPAAAHLPALAGAAGAGAVAVVVAALTGRPSLALSALAVAAAASSPALGPTAALLAAAAVLSLAVGHPAGAALGLPGAAALAALVVPPGRSTSALVVASAAAGTAAALAWSASRWRGDAPAWFGLRPPTVEPGPAVALGAWLILAPGTWEWTGNDDPGRYDRGATVAVAVGGLVFLATTVLPMVRSGPGPDVDAGDRTSGALPGPDDSAAGPVVVPIPTRRRGRHRGRANPQERGDG